MNLTEQLDRSNIKITYTIKSTNVYVILITNAKYLVTTNNINELCSHISILLINKVPISIIENKLNLININLDIPSPTFKPKLTYPKKVYKIPKYSYFPRDRNELYLLVRKLTELRGNKCSLNDIDVSKVKAMDFMFYGSSFNGDISNWNVSNVEDMEYMFKDSYFNGDISNWNVSKVEDMDWMFYGSKFNQDISNWNIYILI